MKDVSNYIDSPPLDGEQSASEALRRLSDDFLNGFSHSLTQPIVAMAQTVDRTGITNIATSIESPKLRETEFGTNGFWSQQFGSAMGMLPWFVAAQKASGKLAGLRHGGEMAALSSAPTAFVLERAAITGFSYGSLLTPTKDAEQLSNISFLLNRSGQGFGSAASFIAMDGAGLSLGATRAKTAAERILAATSGGLLGGLAEAQLTAWRDGRILPTDREVAHSATTMAVLGGGMAGLHAILGNAKHGKGPVERQLRAPGQPQQHQLGDLAPIEHHASARELGQGTRYTATGIIETSHSIATDGMPESDRISSTTERAHQRDKGNVAPDRWLPASLDNTHRILLKTWAGFDTNQKISWLSNFDQVPPYQRQCILITELRLGGDLQKEAIRCIPLLDPQSQAHAYQFANRRGGTEQLLEILHEMHPTARADVLPEIREMHFITKDNIPNDIPSVESNSLLAHRVPEPTKITATLRKDFMGIKGCDVQYEAHEYAVSGHSAKLLIDAARRNETRLARQNQGGDPPIRVVDMVALMDLMPDRRVVKLIEIPDAAAQTDVTAMEGQRYGEASRRDRSIGMFQGEYNPAFSNTFLHEWAHNLYFDHQDKNGGRSALAFKTGAAMEQHKWNFNDYSTKNIDEQLAVHMGEGLLGSRSKFLVTAWNAPIRSATMGRMLGENLASLPPEMHSQRHGEYEWRVQYLKTHIAPEAIRSVSEAFSTVGMEGQAAHLNLLGYLADGASPFEILSKDPANSKVKEIFVPKDWSSDANLAALSNFKHLTGLTIGERGAIPPNILRTLPQSLTRLNLAHDHIPVESIEALAGHTALIRLGLEGQLAPGAVAATAAIPNLTKLGLPQGATTASLLELNSNPRIHWLGASENPASFIGGLRNLQHINTFAFHGELTPELVQELHAMPNLKEVGGMNFSPPGLLTLLRSNQQLDVTMINGVKQP